ncbi:hypothetical protein V5799_008568 [Amblyomma americanum]|uniref:Lipocalin n=1 Tax=Amblyomma americanum TaxID=6943 RepID=A0AAQ4FEI5_AMBAM
MQRQTCLCRRKNIPVQSLCLEYRSSNFAQILTKEQRLHALNTTEPVWLKKSSCNHFPYEPQHICVYSSTVYLNATDYSFNQTYYYGPLRNSSHFYGRFYVLGESSDPVMTVSLEQGGEGINYTLRYINASEHCGVLTYQDESGVECGLHVWNDSVRKPLPGCETAFKTICNGTAYDLFFENCTAS